MSWKLMQIDNQIQAMNEANNIGGTTAPRRGGWDNQPYSPAAHDYPVGGRSRWGLGLLEGPGGID